MDNILFIFRRKDPRFFSIEKIFGAIAECLEHSFSIKKYNLSRYSGGIVDVYRNIREVSRLTADIIHVTGDVHYAVLGARSIPTVLTIHDCNFLHNHRGLKRWLLKQLFLDLPAKKASVITTISEKSRQEIAAALDCDPQRIHVIPNPISPAFRYVEREFGKDGVKVLFIGTTENKNLERSIQALSGLEVQLHILGKPSDSQYQLLRNAGINFSIYQSLSEEEVAGLYACCDLVLYPSLYEGFGMPIVEAQAVGRVVITSAVEPMLSVAGEGAIFVDPFDVKSITQGIQLAIQNTALREEKIGKGKTNTERYSVNAVVRQYKDIYEKLLRR